VGVNNKSSETFIISRQVFYLLNKYFLSNNIIKQIKSGIFYMFMFRKCYCLSKFQTDRRFKSIYRGPVFYKYVNLGCYCERRELLKFVNDVKSSLGTSFTVIGRNRLYKQLCTFLPYCWILTQCYVTFSIA
jgi:hypothetical protein